MSTYASNVAEFRDDVTTLSKADKIVRAEAAKQESWTDPGVLPATFVNVVGGFTYGVSIGFLPILFTFNQYLGNCARYTTSGACAGMTFTGCLWMNATDLRHSRGYLGDDFCAFPDYLSRDVNCSKFTALDVCANSYDGGSCVWSAKTGECSHVVGWTANEQGLLAGASIVGSMIASAFAGKITNRLGRKKSLALVATVVTLACCLLTIAWLEAEAYYTLLVSQIIVGAAGGLLSVICPIYVGEVVTNPSMSSKVGVLFQLSIALGICVCGGVGLIIDPSNDTWQANEYLQERFLSMIAIQWFTAVAVLLVACSIPESPLWLIRRAQAAGDAEFVEDAGCCDDCCPDYDNRESIAKMNQDQQQHTQISKNESESLLFHSEHQPNQHSYGAFINNSHANIRASQASTSLSKTQQQERDRILRKSGYSVSSFQAGYKVPSVVGGVVVTSNASNRFAANFSRSLRASTAGDDGGGGFDDRKTTHTRQSQQTDVRSRTHDDDLEKNGENRKDDDDRDSRSDTSSLSPTHEKIRNMMAKPLF